MQVNGFMAPGGYAAADVYYSVPMRHSTAVTAVGTLPNGQAHSVRQATVSGTPAQDTAVSQFGSSRLFNSANQALLFDGISIEDTRIYGSAQARSYDVWFRPTSTPASPGTLWCVRDTQYGFNSAGQICLFLVYGADNKVAFYISNSDRTIGSSSGTFSSILSTNTFSTGAWHHARVVFGTDGIIRLLVNGTEQGTVAMPATPAGGIATRNKLVIGSAGNVSVYSFPGRIEGFAILDGPSRTPIPPIGIIDEGFREKWDTFSGATISNSDRTFTQTSPATGAHAYGRGRIPRTGRWYCEVNVSDTVSLLSGVGIATASGKTAAARSNGDSVLISAGITAAAQTSYTAGRIMLAFDWANRQMWVGRAGTWFASGDPAAGTNPYYSVLPIEDWFVYTHFGNDGNGNGSAILCCASGNLNHAAPSGFNLLV